MNDQGAGESELERLEESFRQLKLEAEEVAKSINATLPSESCPQCKTPAHCPGFRCPKCGYIHPESWVIVVPTEWGYRVVDLNDQHRVRSEFRIEG